MNIIFHIFGYIGSGLLSILLIPQVYKTYNTKDVSSLSLNWLYLNLITCLCWLVYGIGFVLDNSFIDGCIILIANSSVLSLNLLLIFFIRRYSCRNVKKEISIENRK